MCKKSFFLTSIFLLLGLVSSGVAAVDHGIWIMSKDPFLQDGGADGIVCMRTADFDVNEHFGKIYKDIDPTEVENMQWVGPHIWQNVASLKPDDPNDEPNGVFLTDPNGMQSLPTGANVYGTTFDFDEAPFFDTNAPRLNYRIKFVKTGRHYIHIRGWADNGSSNSLWVGFDDINDAIGRMQFPTDNDANDANELYLWDNDYSGIGTYPEADNAYIDVDSTGLHTLYIWARETGTYINSIVLTTNLDYDPNEVNDMNGPPLSPRRRAACAYGPSPYDGETDVLQKIYLTWSQGDNPSPPSPKHRIYFSKNYDDVNGTDDTPVASQDPCRYPTSGLLGLDWDTTYYWRVDESNSVTGWDVGYIWQFTVEPNCWQLESEHIVNVTAYSSLAGQGPGKTADESGLNANDEHSTTATDMWLSSTTATPRWIKYEFDRLYKLNKMDVWNYNEAGKTSYGLKNVTIEYSTDDITYTPITITSFNQATGLSTYTANTTVNLKEKVAKYVKITATTNHGGGNNYGLSEVRFYRIPLRATRPQPSVGTTELDPRSVVLSWRRGREAAQHKVYISDNEQAVINGTAYVGTVNEPNTSYDTSSLDLDLGKTYYWKINEANPARVPSEWEGDVWQFDTINYMVVEDMEDYNDTIPYRIYYVWRDGWPVGGLDPGNDTGSQVGHWWNTGADFSEESTARGRQSMPLYYENDGSVQSKPHTGGGTNTGLQYYSEATARTTGQNSLNFMTDWIKNGAQALSLWFYGNPDNAIGPNERMYVALEDGNGDVKAVYYDVANGYDPNEVKNPQWHEWVIRLSEFNDVNPSLDVDLSDVRKMHIGFGDRTTPALGTGCTAPIWFFVYIDDIRLYSSWCVPSLRQPDSDLDDDCDVDYDDLAIMASDGHWLVAEDHNGPGELILHWEFEETAGTVAVDSSGKGHHGDINECLINRAGQIGRCYLFDGGTTGAADNVVVQNVDDTNDWMDGLYGLSVCLWIDAATGAVPTDNGFIVFDSMDDFGGDRRNIRYDLVGSTSGLDEVIKSGIGTNSGFQDIESPANRQSSDWQHLAVTWTTGQPVKLYIDGVFTYTFTAESPAWGTTEGYNAVIVGKGKEDEAWDAGWRGRIDDVQIYNYELSAAEVALVKLGNTIPKKCCLYYPTPSPAELYDSESIGSRRINFKDVAVLALDKWLEPPMLWP